MLGIGFTSFVIWVFLTNTPGQSRPRSSHYLSAHNVVESLSLQTNGNAFARQNVGQRGLGLKRGKKEVYSVI